MEVLTTDSPVLLEREERLLSILNCINDALFILDAETGGVLDVNERASELYGYGADDLKKLPPAQLSADVPPYTEEDMLRWIHKANNEGPQLFEWQARHRLGHIFWVEVNMRQATLMGEARLVVTVRDISKRKRSENELRRSEERFQAVVGNPRDPVYCLNLPALTYDYVSPAVEHVLGFSVEECIAGGMRFLVSRIHPDDQPQRQEQMEKLLHHHVDEGFEPALEFRFLHKTRGYRWISESRSVVRDAEGKAVAIIGNLCDITSRREQEEALQQAHAALLFHLENTTLGLVECDTRLNVRRWSQQAEKIFGWKAEEVTGLRPFDWSFIHPDDIPMVEAALHRLLDRSESRNSCVNRNLSRDGRVIVCEWHNSALTNEQGEIQSILCLATDVTLERKVEEALRAMAQGLTAASGEAFFQSLCLHLARILEATHAQVAMLIPEPGRCVQTLGCCADGKVRENFIYSLAGTPGYDVSGGETCHYDHEVQTHFPDDSQLSQAGAVSYMGIPLRASDGRVMGVMAAFSSSVMDTRERLQAIFQIFAARAAAEMERQQAENALRKSEERYALAASGSTGGVWDWDIASGGVYYSPRFRDLLGYAGDEFPNSFTAWEQKIHPDDLPRVREALEGHLTRRAPYRVDYRIKSRSGEYRWFETSGQALWSESGEPLRMAGSSLDIHQRKHTEERVQRLNRLYAVGSSINEAIARVRNPQQLYEAAAHIAVEEGLARMAWVGLLEPGTSHLKPMACAGFDRGYVRSVTISAIDVVKGKGPAGRAFRTGVHAVSNDIENDDTFLSKALALERGFLSCAAFPLKPGGTTTGVLIIYAGERNYFEEEEVRVLNALAENLSFAAGTAHKEQERQEAVEALVEKERMISTLLSNLPGGAAYRARNDDAWSLDFVSQGWREVTGYEPSAFAGDAPMNFRSLMHPDDVEDVRKEVNEALARRKSFEFTYRIRAANGTEKWIWERGQGIFAENGRVQCLEGFVTDVTEKKRMELEFLRAQRMESLGTLAGGIAHDLNNVLTPILMSLSMLRLRLSQPRDLALLTTLESSANRGADMVKQIISFARGVEGRSLLLRPKDVVQEIEHLIVETFPKSIAFSVTYAPDVANLEGDPTQLHQVLLNLCLNARDAMPDGGSLDICVSNVMIDEPFTILNPEAKTGPHVLFEVRDTGSGIPQELLDRIFDPFFTTKEVGKGTGLGLSTTLGIVRSHRGFTQLSSHVGKGTVFHIYIPATTTVSKSDASVADPIRQYGKGELIMVVDDEISILTATTHTLEAFGYRIATARDGSDAIAQFLKLEERPAVVITDMMMPVMDGPSMIQALLNIQPGLPIIATSGLNNHLSTQALHMGVKHFLLKPYDFENLLSILHELLQGEKNGDG